MRLLPFSNLLFVILLVLLTPSGLTAHDGWVAVWSAVVVELMRSALRRAGGVSARVVVNKFGALPKENWFRKIVIPWLADQAATAGSRHPPTDADLP